MNIRYVCVEPYRKTTVGWIEPSFLAGIAAPLLRGDWPLPTMPSWLRPQPSDWNLQGPQLCSEGMKPRQRQKEEKLLKWRKEIWGGGGGRWCAPTQPGPFRLRCIWPIGLEQALSPSHSLPSALLPSIVASTCLKMRSQEEGGAHMHKGGH